MASTVKDRIKVANLTKFGFQVGTEFVNYSKQLPEADKTQVVPGAEFDAEMYVADSGKRYLNKILASVHTLGVVAPTIANPLGHAVDTERAKKFTPKFQKKEDTSSGLSKDEWAAKDVRISRQGCIQAAVHALGPVLGADSLFAEASKLADQMLAYVNKK
jgi:hypothetical protein